MDLVYSIELTAVLFAAVVVLGLAANRIGFPFPVLLVFAGAGLGISPRFPSIDIDPDVIFMVCLPPLLYAASVRMPWREFRESLLPISWLAIGLVLATTAAVAAVAHLFIPGMTLAAAATLGAIVGPTDVVSVTATARRFRIPDRVVTILEGESLINDASSLVAYRFAVLAVLTGSFTWQQVGTHFVVAVFAGGLVGLAFGSAVVWLFRRIEDTAAQITLSLIVPYIAFLAAEQLELSGVLAVVTAGLTVGRRHTEVSSASSRIDASAVFATIEYIMNGVLFLLVGMQVQSILQGLRGWTTQELLTYAGLVSGVVILVRLVWAVPVGIAVGWLSPRLGMGQVQDMDWRSQVLVGWSGMRGVVSLAAALALPLSTSVGAPFPDRGLIIFLTASVVLVTLVVSGLTMPLMARVLRVGEEGDRKDVETDVRERLLRTSIEEFDRREKEGELPREIEDAAWLRQMLEGRRAFSHAVERMEALEVRRAALELCLDILEVERSALRSLFIQRRVNKEIFGKLEREIDLEEARIRSVMGGRVFALREPGESGPVRSH